MNKSTMIYGGIAGLLATAPMTVAMEAIRRQLPFWQRKKQLPPEQIAMEMAEAVHIKDELDSEERLALTAAGHFGYGALSGVAYGAFAEKTELPPVVSGSGFGLALWAVSYLGWLPAAGVRRSAAKEPTGINAMMIGSHLVWGVATALVYEALREGDMDAAYSRR